MGKAEIQVPTTYIALTLIVWTNRRLTYIPSWINLHSLLGHRL